MPSPNLKQCSSLVGTIDRQLPGHLSTKKMKIGKAPVLLKKAVTMCKCKTGGLADRILFLASLRRKIARVGAISHRIHTLMMAADRATARMETFHKTLMMRKTERTPVHGGEMVYDLSHQLALFDQEGNGDGDAGSADWTLHPIFNDDDDNCCYNEEYEEDVDEPSVMNVIRSNREVEGLEFNVDDDIDQAAEMFISRFREQMNKSFSDHVFGIST